jgi:hypothetical protein
MLFQDRMKIQELGVAAYNSLPDELAEGNGTKADKRSFLVQDR